jgi:thiol-disulfide isomerase/thioredoxin
MTKKPAFNLIVIGLCAVIIIAFIAIVVTKLPKPEINNIIQSSDVSQGSEAPDFTVTLNNGQTFTLSDYKDRVVLINFWATWCPPCVGELPAFEQLKKDNLDGFVFVAVNCSEPKSTVDSFISQNGYTFNIAYDEDGSVQKLYPTDGIPYTLVIKNGVVERTFLGAPQDAYNVYKNAVEECMN